MSIPERFYRIAKYKLREIKDRFDQLDQEASRDSSADRARDANFARAEARRELDEPISESTMVIPRSTPAASYPAPRTPREITTGSRASVSGPYLASNPPRPPAGGVSASATPAVPTVVPVGDDPLAFHYRLLGVPVDCEFVEVQTAYNRLSARSDPSRFPAGSDEEKQAKEIRDRLDASFNALRDALDPTARRFDLLEY